MKLPNPATLSLCYALRHDRLYKIGQNGSLTPVLTLQNGTPVSVYGGVTLNGRDIAWSLLYGVTPTYPVTQLGRDPYDMSPANLMPVRRKRLRFRWSDGGGFRHCLDKSVAFSTLEACHDDWLRHARAYYQPDLEFVLAQARAAQGPVAPVPEPKVRKAYTRKKPLVKRVVPEPPAAVPGRQWCYVGDQWVSVPEPCHPSDDQIMRALAVQAGAVGMRFDKEQQRCLPVYA
jgi:hypothetical protein